MVIDGVQVRGMCHRTEAAERPIKDLTTVYDVGDLVKAVVLKVIYVGFVQTSVVLASSFRLTCAKEGVPVSMST